MKKGLGRGLDSIFADNYIEVAAKEKEMLITKAAQAATGQENTISELENLQKELQHYL